MVSYPCYGWKGNWDLPDIFTPPPKRKGSNCNIKTCFSHQELMKRAVIFKAIFFAKIKPSGTLKLAQDETRGKKSQLGFQLGSSTTPFPRMTVVSHTSSGKENCCLIWWQPNRGFKGLSGIWVLNQRDSGAFSLRIHHSQSIMSCC